jgi:hypothetical protein
MVGMWRLDEKRNEEDACADREGSGRTLVTMAAHDGEDGAGGDP